MPKEGFKNQWIPISKIGKFADSEGVERDLDESFLKDVIANFAPNDAPAVIGHPKDNAPAFGWTTALRLNGDVLEAQFADTNDDFEEMVEKGSFRKRSASFYLNPPSLRHVGFLGAMPPAVKGLQDIQFNDGESVTVEISFNEGDQLMSKENEAAQEEKKTFKEWVKEFFGGDKPNAPSANFSEADMQKLIDASVKTATETITADFTAKLDEKDKEIQSLRDDVNKQTSSGKHAEIVSFVESIPAEKGKHFLKNIGVVNFLEACANADAANNNAEFVAFSEGEGDDKKEHKFTLFGWAKNLISSLPPMIQFGEKFGDIKATAEAEKMVDANRVNAMKEEMGIQPAGGKK